MITLHKLPIDFWGEKAIGMITSIFGGPIMMDSATYHKRKQDYARVLVALKRTTPPPMSVCVVCPLGKENIMKLGYDSIPKLYSKCLKFDHYEANCKYGEMLFMVRRVGLHKNSKSSHYATNDPQLTTNLHETRLNL